VQQGASVLVVQDAAGGSYAGNSSAGGLPGAEGSYYGGAGAAFGTDFFLGGDVTFNVTGTLSLNSLGGAGQSLINPSVNGNDPNAQGGICLQGGGTLVLTGTSYYSGTTVINSGTLVLGQDSWEIGTAGVVVGEASNDNGTLVLAEKSNLTTSGASIVVGSGSNARGTVVIGADGEGADVSGIVFSGGLGGGEILFQATGTSNSEHPIFVDAQFTGNLTLVQNASGTVVLRPVIGPNSYTGGTFVNSGVLQLAPIAYFDQGLPSGGAVTVNGGMLDLNGQTVSVGAIAVNGGKVGDSAGGGDLEATSITTQSGTIGVNVSGSTALVQNWGGTTTLSGSNSYSGGTTINGGTLVVSNNQGLGEGWVQVNGGSLEVRGDGGCHE